MKTLWEKCYRNHSKVLCKKLTIDGWAFEQLLYPFSSPALLSPLYLIAIENMVGNGAFACNEKMFHLLQ